MIWKSHRNFFHLDRLLISIMPIDALEIFLLALMKVMECSIFFHFEVPFGGDLRGKREDSQALQAE